ncbi:MAG: fibronectin type III domain-containing protein [Polyangiaceae bacterium]|nr:fibronectin type III domain-containing protein [Polyangiaceae bacterium]
MPNVFFSQPQNGFSIQAGQPLSMSWTSSGATSHRLQYSLDGGILFTPIVTGLGANTKSYTWQIPETLVPAGSGPVSIVVRVIARDEITAEIADDFCSGTLLAKTSTQTLSVDAFAPTGGTFEPGEAVIVQWNSQGATSHRVQVSIDGGAFSPIATGLSPSTSSFIWSIPESVVPAGKAQVSATFKVIARDESTGQTAEDIAPGNIVIVAAAVAGPTVSVTSPTAGTFAVGQTIGIVWNSSGATSHRIQLAVDNGAFSPLVTGLSGADRSFSYVVPSAIVPAGAASAKVVFKVIAKNDGTGQTAESQSDSVTVTPAAPVGPLVDVTGPFGGTFAVGSQVAVQWVSTGATSHRVQVAVNGQPFSPIATGLSGSDKVFVWTIPTTLIAAGSPPASVFFKVIAKNDTTGKTAEDVSPAAITVNSTPLQAPSISVVAPSGGKVKPGDTVLIQWISTGATSHRIQTAANGQAFVPLIAGLSGQTMSYAWKIPLSFLGAGVPSASVQIKVIAKNDISGQTAESLLSAPITVEAPIAAPNVEVTAPAGGSYKPGNVVVVEWTSLNATSHVVQAQVGNGPSLAIAPALGASARSFSWQVPVSIAPPGSAPVSVRISVIAKNDTTGSMAQDEAPLPITIVPNAAAITVRVTTPNGGAVTEGDELTISWVSSGAESHRIEQSAVGASSTNVIVSGLPGQASTYKWTVPVGTVPAGSTSVNLTVSVVAQSGSTQVVDVSDAPLTVKKKVIILPQVIDPEDFPVILGVDPNKAPVGAEIEINGSNFDPTAPAGVKKLPAPIVIFLNAHKAPLLLASILSFDNKEIKARIPDGAKTGKIIVKNTLLDKPTDLEGLPSNPFDFTVTPVITEFNPKSGGVATAVTIFGTGLYNTPQFTFTGKDGARISANFSDATTDSIRVAVPEGAITGPIQVITAGGGTAKTMGDFVVKPQIPQVEDYKPKGGEPMTVVTLFAKQGTKFEGINEVSFLAAPSLVKERRIKLGPGQFRVSGDMTRITVAVPYGAVTGKIRVTNASGSSSSGVFTIPLNPPTVLAAVGAVGPSVNVSWKDTTTTETGFRIERKTGQGAFTTLTTVPTNVSSYADKDVTAKTTYTYRVIAVRSTNAQSLESQPSNEAAITVMGTVTTSPLRLFYKKDAMNATAAQMVMVSRGAGVPAADELPVQTSANVPWLLVAPSAAKLTATAPSVTVSVAVDYAVLNPGRYSAVLTVGSTAADASVSTVAVEVVVQ